MTKLLIVMMIWGGSAHGGPTTIQGFETMAACEASIQTVRSQMARLAGVHVSWTNAICVQLPAN